MSNFGMGMVVEVFAEAREDYRINNIIKLKTSRIMKKLLMISVMFLVGALSVSAQTYRYRQTTKVDPDGVKSKGLDLVEYFTFSGEMCYESDKDGNLRKPIAGEDNSIYK